MKQFLQRILLGLSVASMAGCSSISTPSLGSLFGGEGSAIHVTESKKANPNAPRLKYAASIHINPYSDARKMDDPRKLGMGAKYVSGMSGNDIVLDQDVATVVTEAMKTRLDDAGFQVSDARDGNALFELSGVVKELAYDVKARDEVSIIIETTLKETSTGKIVWSGTVTEKTDRFAGVSGNNKNDIATYLRNELDICTEKTTKAISASLMVIRPDLFNPTPDARPASGVTTLSAPTAALTFPVQQIAPIPAGDATVPVPAYAPHATATSGLLLINTSPARASIYLDSVYYGLSPLHLEMAPGVYAINVKLEGYKVVNEKVSVRKGDTTEMSLNLEHN